MKRRHVTVGLLPSLGCYGWHELQQRQCLNTSRRATFQLWIRYLPYCETRCHGFMVFDTLHGQTSAERGFVATPQMVAGHTIENDARTWYLQLRDGLLFHDGTKVLARDCVASIRRWGVHDLLVKP